MPRMLIDTHCHLTYQGLLDSQESVVARALAAGVQRMITIGTHPHDHELVATTLRNHHQVFAAIGIHPHHAGEVHTDFVADMQRMFEQTDKLIAVGECGLDYHGQSAAKDVQRQVLIFQLELARKLKKPVILHVRDAHADALAIMSDYGDIPHVVHCFTGSPEECGQWINRGAYVGITGIVTYKNAPDVHAAARMIPEDRLLVETDSPYLTPQAVRKIKINEPAFVVHVAERVAMERGVSLDRIAELTTHNALRLFGQILA